MPLDVTFTLSDDDLNRFQGIVDKARSALEDETAVKQIEVAARKLLDEIQAANLPDFIAQRMQKLGVVLEMINDDEWQLSDEERRRVLSGLAYLVDSEDLIPDHIPGLGFLDDAIYAEIIIDELRTEIEHYEEFCAFRNAEEARRKARGEDVNVGREEWLADKRAALHARMRKRRSTPASSGRWRMSLWP